MRRRRRQGFTLIELYLTLIVVSAVMVSLVGAIFSISRHLPRPEWKIQALSLAGAYLTQWQIRVGHGGSPAELLSEGDFEDDFQDYRWSAVIDPVGLPSDLEGAGGTGVEGLYQIGLDVFRRGRPDPLVRAVAQGWRSAEPESSDGAP